MGYPRHTMTSFTYNLAQDLFLRTAIFLLLMQRLGPQQRQVRYPLVAHEEENLWLRVGLPGENWRDFANSQ